MRATCLNLALPSVSRNGGRQEGSSPPGPDGPSFDSRLDPMHVRTSWRSGNQTPLRSPRAAGTSIFGFSTCWDLDFRILHIKLCKFDRRSPSYGKGVASLIRSTSSLVGRLSLCGQASFSLIVFSGPSRARPRIDPKSTSVGATSTEPNSTLGEPQMDPESTPDGPQTDHMDLRRTLIDPRSTNTNPRSIPS